MKILIEPSYHGTLLRTYLRGVLHISSALLAKMKRAPGAILLNGSPVTVLATLSAGDYLTLSPELCDRENSSDTTTLPVALPLHILYEDEDILIVNKPSGMPTHPSFGHYEDTLANAVMFWWKQCGKETAVFRPINRLDRNTSGIVLIAANAISANRLSLAMQRKQIHKTYLAILDGVPSLTEGTIEKSIRRSGESIIRREVCLDGDPGAQPACTRYQVLAQWNPISGGHARSLVMAFPVTGRTHQLRVHFSSMGTPILGDDMYGECLPAEIDRQALHAVSISLPHPTTGRNQIFTAPLPQDMISLLPQPIKHWMEERLYTSDYDKE